MKTKIVELKTGEKITLYQNSFTNEWTSERNKAIDRFHSQIINGTTKKSRVIRQYYCESTIEYTRNKIVEMVNSDERNIDLLYDTIVNEILNRR